MSCERRYCDIHADISKKHPTLENACAFDVSVVSEHSLKGRHLRVTLRWKLIITHNNVIKIHLLAQLLENRIEELVRREFDDKRMRR